MSQILRIAALLLVVFPSLAAAAQKRSCGSMFAGTTDLQTRKALEPFDPASSSVNFLNFHIPDSGLERLSKSQLETLFTLRDRIRSGDAARTKSHIATEAEAELVSKITKRTWKIGDTVSMNQFENQIALPAFKLLAFKAAVLRLKFEKQRIGIEVDPDEVYQAAMIGLVDTIRTYRPDADHMFSTWAFNKMKAEFYDVARESTAGMAMASTPDSYLLLTQYLRVARVLQNNLGREPTDAEVADLYAKTYAHVANEATIREALARGRAAKSTRSTYIAEPKTSQDIDENTAHEFDALSLVKSDETPVTLLEAQQMRETLSRLLYTLTPREQKVLGLRFGLDPRVDNEESYSAVVTDHYTLEEIGKMYGVGKSRIQQIEQKAIRKLKHPSRSDELTDVLSKDP